jgi:hypothetical protein
LFYHFDEASYRDETRTSDGPNFKELTPEFYTPIEGSYAALFQVSTADGHD